MKSFDYVRPATIAEAIAAAAAPGASYLAAGTNLLDLMKGGVARPDRLVDVTRVSGLDRIEKLPDGGVRIGALVRNADLAYNSEFSSAYPAVAEALLSGASAQLRNATGAAMLQRPDAPISTILPALVTSAARFRYDARRRNRTHASLAGVKPVSRPTHPFCVPLVALDAVVEIEGP